MEIREITIKHFGKFENQKMEFHSGLNVIYGENETGKSTICSFIRGMLFGIEKMRGRAAGNDEYSLRQPWDAPVFYAGTMRFASGNKTFFLERSFYHGDKTVRLMCEDDGEELDPENGDLEALLEDISKETYSNTFYYGSHTGETTDSLAEEIHNYLVNAASGHISQMNVTKAVERLKKERKVLEVQKKKMVEESAIAARDIRMRMEYEQQELSSLRMDEKKQRQKLDELEAKIWQKDREPEQTARYEEAYGSRKLWIAGKIFTAIMAAAGLGIGILSSGTELKIVGVALIILACIGVRFFSSRDQEAKAEVREQNIQKREQELEEEYLRQSRREELRLKHEVQKQRQRMNLEWIQNSIAEKEAQLDELQEQYDQIVETGVQKEDLELEIAARTLAEATLSTLTTEVYQEYEDRLNERISQILSQITGGRYDRIFVDEELKVNVYAKDRRLTLKQVSRGTMEQICFALRMAVGEMLNPGDPLPIILDDAFLTYDDERLQNTLSWLRTCNRQVILFTCQNRERE